jgi:guanosine-3',5'-bis(diphosphate) 3'-pyrophosphohydrolase
MGQFVNIGEIMRHTHKLIITAMEFANEVHRAHMYSSTQPYVKHLEDVYNVLLRYGCNNSNEDELEILVAAWLHDCMEDTATSYTDVKKVFGESIADIVYCLTDELGRNRKEKKEKTYPKIKSNWKSIIVKAGDRVANYEQSLTHQDEKSFSEMYKKEYEEFKRQLMCGWDECIKIYPKAKKCEWILAQLWNRLDELNSADVIKQKRVTFTTPSGRKLIAFMSPIIDDDVQLTETAYDEIISMMTVFTPTSMSCKKESA